MASAGGDRADLIFTGGIVHTVDADNSIAEAVAVAGGRILAVGSNAEIEGHAGPATSRVELRGRSLLPICAGKTATPRDALYFDFAGNHHAVRMGKWKLVSKDRGPWELYDIEADRSELNDLSKQHVARTEQMRQAWQTWAKQAGVKTGAKGRKKKTKKKRKKPRPNAAARSQK